MTLQIDHDHPPQPAPDHVPPVQLDLTYFHARYTPALYALEAYLKQTVPACDRVFVSARVDGNGFSIHEIDFEVGEHGKAGNGGLSFTETCRESYALFKACERFVIDYETELDRSADGTSEIDEYVNASYKLAETMGDYFPAEGGSPQPNKEPIDAPGP